MTLWTRTSHFCTSLSVI